MSWWASYVRHPLVILTLSVLSAVVVAGLACPAVPPEGVDAALDGKASAALPLVQASLASSGQALPVGPVVQTHAGTPSTEAAVALKAPGAKRLAGAAQMRILNHTVQEGENLSGIAARYGCDVETLLGLNQDLHADRLRTGQTIRVMTGRGAVYQLRKGETLADLSKRFWVAEEKIRAANGLLPHEEVKPGEEIILPGIKPRRRDDDLASRGLGPLYIAWPVRGWISSRFGQRWGRMHEGLDIAVFTGSAVRASAPGRVEFAGWRAGYGQLVIIDHGRGIHTRYGHNSRLLVRAGQWVDRGQTIAFSGSTGTSTGPHVHFEVRVNGRPQNPLSWLRR